MEPAGLCACNAGDLSLMPSLGRSPGEGHGYPLQYSCLENPMNRGAWQAAVHGVTESWTQLNNLHFFTLLAGAPQAEPRGGGDSDPCSSPPTSSLLRFSPHLLPLRSPNPPLPGMRLQTMLPPGSGSSQSLCTHARWSTPREVQRSILKSETVLGTHYATPKVTRHTCLT